MEAFVEILVKRKINFKDIFSVASSIVVIILGSVMGICLSKFIFACMPIVVVADFFVIHCIIMHKQIEFEYTVVGNEIDVDKIIGKRKRKRLITIRKSDVYHVGVLNDKEYSRCRRLSNKVIEASSNKSNEDNCYVLLNDSKKTLVILDWHEAIIRGIKK